MPELFLGGQAVVEGVMMRSQTHYTVAVRRPDGTIAMKSELVPKLPRFFKLPFIRGVAVLYHTLGIGMKALLYSANEAAGESEQLSKKEISFTFLFAGLFAIGIFVAIPFVVATFSTDNNEFLFNVVDGAVRVVLFLTYLLIISMFKDVRRMFEYHGAEHMAVHAYEHKKSMTAKEIRKFPTMHPRCGTSFLLIVLLTSIVVFTFITHDNTVIKFFSRIALIPVIASISYEALRFSAKFSESVIGKAFVFPGLLLQYITTKQPDDSQIEVAIAAINDVVKTSQK